MEYSMQNIEELSQIYKLCASVPRLLILLKLAQGESTASELINSCGLSQSATSHQLKDLRQTGLISSRKDGLNVLYKLNDHHIINILKIGIAHVRGEEENE